MDKYCTQIEIAQGEFRTAENYWMYLGFFSLISIGLLAGFIVEWRLDAGVMDRAMPGTYAGEELYLNLPGDASVELKVIEYAALFVMFVLLFVCYAMSVR